MSLFSIFSKKAPEPTSVAEALAGTGEGSPAKSRSRRSENRHADAQNEQLVPEKKRARRRLIGAVAIVLAVVIGLPMVLDSEPKPLNKNIIIQIPSKDSATSSSNVKEEVVPEEASDQAAKQPTIAVADTPQRTVATVTPQPVAAPPASVEPESVPKASKPDTKPDARHTADTVSKKDTTAKSRSDIKAPDARGANNDEAARAMAILAGADPATKTTTRIVVQVGAFATQEKVNELQDKLNSAGIKSFTQKVATSSGDKIRVRIGPFSDRESADKVKLQLEKIGLNGSLISL